MSDVAATQWRASGVWGWRVLMLVSALITLNGVGWYFAGPATQTEDLAEQIGIGLAEFETTYPDAAAQVVTATRLTAFYYIAIGTMGAQAARAGQRTGASWPWRITWVLVALPAAILTYGLARGAGLAGFTAMMLGLSLLALVGQLAARRSLPS